MRLSRKHMHTDPAIRISSRPHLVSSVKIRYFFFEICLLSLVIAVKILQEDHEKPVDEDEVTDAHRKAYDEGNTSGMSAKSMGGAAALQVNLGFFLVFIIDIRLNYYRSSSNSPREARAEVLRLSSSAWRWRKQQSCLTSPEEPRLVTSRMLSMAPR